MADKKFTEDFTHKDEPDDEIKIPAPKSKPKLTGKVIAITPFAVLISYIVNGETLGTRVEYDARLHSKLKVDDDIQITT